jgi:hypothetical protein
MLVCIHLTLKGETWRPQQLIVLAHHCAPMSIVCHVSVIMLLNTTYLHDWMSGPIFPGVQEKMIVWSLRNSCVLKTRTTRRQYCDFRKALMCLVMLKLTGRRPTKLRFLILIFFTLMSSKSRDSSVGIALHYRLDDRGSRVRFPAGAGNFSLHHRVQNGCGAHPASYPMGTGGSFPEDKAAGA